MKAQTYAQVVLRRGGPAKHNLPTANSQQPYACDVRFVRPNRVLYAVSSHFDEVIPKSDQTCAGWLVNCIDRHNDATPYASFLWLLCMFVVTLFLRLLRLFAA